jgi:hypothetical protein
LAKLKNKVNEGAAKPKCRALTNSNYHLAFTS